MLNWGRCMFGCPLWNSTSQKPFSNSCCLGLRCSFVQVAQNKFNLFTVPLNLSLLISSLLFCLMTGTHKYSNVIGKILLPSLFIFNILNKSIVIRIKIDTICILVTEERF